MRARLTGPSHEFWNLTDGGHLDNSAAYELLRRQVPFIILVDATSDPEYTFEALASLERDARIDFDAEICWRPNQGDLPGWIRSWIDPIHLGALDDLRGNSARGGPGRHRGVLAQITYGKPGGPQSKSWLLVVKASLNGSESLDVAQYARAHSDFPQESTADQIYDDEQWESYRRLGFQAGDAIFADPSDHHTPP